MDLIFLGTGGAWGVPELNCACRICVHMRHKAERRTRTALLFSGETNLLVDCGPDIAAQLDSHRIDHLDGLLITHEHGDHYIGLDELYSYKRTIAKGTFEPIPVYMTADTWNVIGARFGYLVSASVIRVHLVEPGHTYGLGEFRVMPFKTDHGSFASGSVGYVIDCRTEGGKQVRLVYTSDFIDIPETITDLFYPDYLIIQAFWLNEPVFNHPNHMSFQRALDFIEQWKPKEATYLVHIGAGDQVPGDPANEMVKKYEPADPLRSPVTGMPYPIPMDQGQWQETVDRIAAERALNHTILVAYDGLRVRL